MLYPKSKSKKFNVKLFKNPTKEYRGAPFWSWNCDLKQDILEKEIEYMKEMGFGGFYMHPRIGMQTPYLSDEYMSLVNACIRKGQKVGLNACLYDEDNYPSGSAGGFVTKLSANNGQKFITFTNTEKDDNFGMLLACFDIVFSANSKLISYRKIDINENARGGEKWYIYLRCKDYCDLLSKQAVDAFINLTHEKYSQNFNKDFAVNVPTIFTDEPQTYPKETLNKASDKTDVSLPYTTDFNKTCFTKYGVNVEDHLPVLIWENEDGTISPIRYYYHEHIAQRFAESFSYNIGDWCAKHGIAFTGHVMNESSLLGQTLSLGEAMRHYKGFQIPGVDILCDFRELTTVKQAQSVARQYGKDGVTSELYGVTNWDFDFSGHKLQGDWQAAMGVTHRVLHLYWVSMEGEGKRDYPASIGHQSPWYKEYPLIENHFARINTVMTRGTPKVDIAVIHPIESYWLHFGPNDQTGETRQALSVRFNDLTKWILFGMHDFDFISEALLPEQFNGCNGGFNVGKMKYKSVIVPELTTIRTTTLNSLKQFRACGGEVIFMGKIPTLVDALPSREVIDFAKECTVIDYDKNQLLSVLESKRFVDVTTEDNERNFIYSLRKDGNKLNLFISHVNKSNNVEPTKAIVTIKGDWNITLLNTLNGTKQKLYAKHVNGNTILTWYQSGEDSLLLQLKAGKSIKGNLPLPKEYAKREQVENIAYYTLEEPNVLLLDTACYSFNGGKWSTPLNVLKIDDNIRSMMGDNIPRIDRPQPWTVDKNKTPTEKVSLKFEFSSDIDYTGAKLALEYPQNTEVIFNGASAPVLVDGIFVDDSIKTISLPKIQKGNNQLIININYGYFNSIESYYILGNFGVKVDGEKASITSLPDKLTYQSITEQNLSFYGGNITYSFEIDGGGKKAIEVTDYRGAVIKVKVDGKQKGYIAFPPYKLDLGKLSKGKHKIDLILYGNRMNTFGQLHNANNPIAWAGPNSWRTSGTTWTNDYMLRKTGILSSPIILTEE